MWMLAVEGVAPPSDLTAVAVWTFLGVVVTTLGLLGQQALKGRNERTGTTASPPPASDAATLLDLAKDTGALQEGQRTLVERADDSDDRDEVQDRRLDKGEREREDLTRRVRYVEEFLGRHHHDWRGP